MNDEVNNQHIESKRCIHGFYVDACLLCPSSTVKMTMTEAREAFERHEAKVAQVPYEEFKLRFDSYEEKIGERYIDGSLRHKHWVIWLASWQEQQRRIDQLEMNLRFVIDHFVMNDLDKAMPRVFEEMKEVLIGEA